MVLLLTQKMEKNWLLIISFIFLGCIQNGDPSYILPQETFKSILIDVYGKKDIVNIKNNTTETTQNILNSVLDKYQVSDTIYKKTLLFYFDHPDRLLDIIQEIEQSKES